MLCVEAEADGGPFGVEEADIDKNGHVDYKEFILMITVLFLTSANPLSAAGDSDDNNNSATIVDNAVQKVLEAFLFFDRDGDGYIEKAEVTQIMREGAKEGGKGGGAKSVISAERFEVGWVSLFPFIT